MTMPCFAFFQLLDWLAAFQQSHNLAAGGFGVIAKKFCGADLIEKVEPDFVCRRFARTCPGFTRFGLLLGHGGVELVEIDAYVPALERVLCKIEREAVGIVKLERHIAGQRVAVASSAPEASRVGRDRARVSCGSRFLRS